MARRRVGSWRGRVRKVSGIISTSSTMMRGSEGAPKVARHQTPNCEDVRGWAAWPGSMNCEAMSWSAWPRSSRADQRASAVAKTSLPPRRYSWELNLDSPRQWAPGNGVLTLLLHYIEITSCRHLSSNIVRADVAYDAPDKRRIRN